MSAPNGEAILSPGGIMQINSQNGGNILRLIDSGHSFPQEATPRISFGYLETNGVSTGFLGNIGYEGNSSLKIANAVGDNLYTVPSGKSHIFNQEVSADTLDAPELKTNSLTSRTSGSSILINGGINFPGGTNFNNYTEINFSPNATFANEGLFTVKEGIAVRIGSTVHVHIRIAGPASSRYTTPSIIMGISNIPLRESVARRSVFSVIERYGAYPDGKDTKQAVFNTSTNILNFVHPDFNGRDIAKTVADWPAGDFEFFIYGVLFLI
jgi:hypothetical protein